MNRSHLLPLLVLLVAGVLAWRYFFGPSPQRDAFRARALATRVLAGHLVKTRAGTRVLILSNPFTQRSGVAGDIVAMEEAGLRGLREGFGKQIPIGAIAFPDLKPEARSDPRSLILDTETPTPLSFLVTDESLDRLVQQHSGCDLIVSLIGLPAHLDAVQAWQAPGAPRFALLLPDLRLVGNLAAIKDALQKGKLAAFVLPKPGAPPANEPVTGDAAAEFARRFLLVTAESIADIAQRNPQLFPAGQ